MGKLLTVIVFSLFFDVQLVVSSKERPFHYETLQNVSQSEPEILHQGGGRDSQEELGEPQPDAWWDQALDALL